MIRELIFWDVDTQYDFMINDGKLYVPNAEEIIPILEKLYNYARKNEIQIMGSADYHTLQDEECKGSQATFLLVQLDFLFPSFHHCF